MVQAPAGRQPDETSGGSVPTLSAYARENGLTSRAFQQPLPGYLAELWRRRHFVIAFAAAKSASMHAGARLGQLWQLLTPLLNALIYYAVFGILLGRGGDVSEYIPFLVTGVFFFHFTQRSVLSGVRSVREGLDLVRAVHFPRASLPLTSTFVELQHLGFALVVLFALLTGLGEYPTWRWALVLPVLVLQLMFNVGAALVVARLGVFVPDLGRILPFALRFWLYFSGIFFALYTLAGKAPAWAMRALEANPGAVYVELARRSLVTSYRHDLAHVRAEALRQCHSATAPAGTVAAGCRRHAELLSIDHTIWLYAVTWGVTALVAGFWFFHRAELRYGRG